MLTPEREPRADGDLASNPNLDQALRHAFCPASASATDAAPADDRDDLSEPAPGTWFEERYEVLGTLGRGGVGILLRARDHVLGRDVAVKLLQQRHAERSSLVQRFLEEGQIAAQLEHPGIVAVHEVGMAADGRPFLVMKLVAGHTLAALLAEPQREPQRLIAVFATLCQTIAYAHTRDVIHRDLKPANVMVGSFGEVQVMDWGMAKVLRPTGPGASTAAPVETVRSINATSASVTGSVMGTYAYMAPEQARGDTAALDKRADVFGLGAILCEILTGAPPYRSESAAELRRMATEADLGDARDRLTACGADPELVKWARLCLAADATERPANASVLAHAFEQHFAATSERARTAELAAAAAEARVLAERRTRRWQVGLALLVMVAVIGATGAWLWVQAEQRARADESTRAVDAALTEARGQEGLLQSGANPSAWLAFVAAARRGRDLARMPDTPAATRERAEAFCADAEGRDAAEARQRAQREKDLRFRQSLQEFWLRSESIHELADKRRAHIACYRDYGLDLEKCETAVLSAAIQASPIAEELITGLSYWPTTIIPEDNLDPTTALVRQLVDALDRDEQRLRIRAASKARDQAAMTALAAELDLDAASQQTLVRMVVALEECGDQGAAIAFARRSLIKHPGDAWLNIYLGQMLMDTGADPSEVIRYYSNGRALVPDHYVATRNLALALNRAGQSEEAAGLQVRQLRSYPTDADLHFNLAETYRIMGRHEDCLRKAAEAARLNSGDADAYIVAARALRALGRCDEAEEWFQRAFAVAPDSAQAHLSFGAMLCDDLGRFAEAVEHFRQVTALAPKVVDGHFNLALALKRMGQNAAALENFQKAAAIDPHHLRAQIESASLLYESNRFELAMEASLKAVELAPTNPTPRVCLGAALYHLERFDEALAQLHEACRLQPDSALAWVRIGEVKLQVQDLPAAEAALRRASELYGTPANPEDDYDRYAVHTLLGRCLVAQGRPAEAAVDLRAAAALAPNDPKDWVRLGQALLAAGDPAGAEDAFARGLQLDSTDVEARNGQEQARRLRVK